jgi:hypothetical protein
MSFSLDIRKGVLSPLSLRKQSWQTLFFKSIKNQHSLHRIHVSILISAIFLLKLCIHPHCSAGRKPFSDGRGGGCSGWGTLGWFGRVSSTLGGFGRDWGTLEGLRDSSLLGGIGRDSKRLGAIGCDSSILWGTLEGSGRDCRTLGVFRCDLSILEIVEGL